MDEITPLDISSNGFNAGKTAGALTFVAAGTVIGVLTVESMKWTGKRIRTWKQKRENEAWLKHKATLIEQ